MLVSSIAIVFIVLVAFINGKALDINENDKRSIGWARMISGNGRNNIKRSTGKANFGYELHVYMNKFIIRFYYSLDQKSTEVKEAKSELATCGIQKVQPLD